MKLRNIGALLYLMSPSSLVSAQAALPVDVPVMECETLHDLMNKAARPVLVDVRAPVDFTAAHIVGAVSIPFYKLPKDASWPKGTPLVLYCDGKGCPLSGDSALALIKSGYTDVKVLNGGIREWIIKEYPVVRNEMIDEAQPKIRENTIFAGRTVTAKQLSEYLNIRRNSGPNGDRGGDNLQILDLRPENEFAAAHLSGAKNISFEKLQEKMKDFLPNAEIVVCAKTLEIGEQAVLILNRSGFPAHYLVGGIIVWSAAGYPLMAGKDYAK